MRNSWQTALKDRVSEEFVDKSQEWVDLTLSTSGLLNLTVVSDKFAEKTFLDRRQQVLDVLSTIKSPAQPGFLSLYTLQEAESLQVLPPVSAERSEVKTWQALAQWASNPQNEAVYKAQSQNRKPRTITFYSYKGGVGRTTALTHVAWILALRGRKVVAIDLDLEAPGLSTAFNLKTMPEYGIADYFYSRAYSPEDVEPDISITQIFGEVDIPNARGRLFVVPAGSLSLDYIAKVDDLHATTVLSNGEDLWSTFEKEIQNHLNPDILLVDSRTGLNQWGALSLLQAADEVIILLFPNEQNRQGIDLLIQSLQSLKNISFNFVFTPVPDTTELGLTKVRAMLSTLQKRIQNSDDSSMLTQYSEADSQNYEQLELMDFSSGSEDLDGALVIPYLPSIATADSYPVIPLLDYYSRIANLVDEETDKLERTEVLAKSEHRWEIIHSLAFPEVNAADQKQNLGLLFQKTTDFETFLDNTTCLIRGRKGTGKTALYWLLLKHFDVAQKLAYGRLDNIRCFSGHGRFHPSRPSRDEFQIIHDALRVQGGTWEAFWRAYLLLRTFQDGLFKIPRGQKGKKFTTLKKTLKNVGDHDWRSEHTTSLIHLATNSDCVLVVKDALSILDEHARETKDVIWLLYDDLDEDFPSRNEVRTEALAGLFRLVQSCDARRMEFIRFKIFLREDIWQRLVFDNKSHFNGRELLLQWTRIDFLRLALRQAMQSQEFKSLVSRFSPVESVDQANEETINRALELLWGTRRRRGGNAKYVSRWVYERLTDSSNTTFPRSLSILLQGAKTQELSYRDNSAIQAPTDRLLRSKSLEKGLREASKERCDAIKEEYPDLAKFFDHLKAVAALAEEDELRRIWEESAQQVISTFEEFVAFISEVGLVEWRTKDQRYRFADIYVYGFEMSRTGAV